MKPFDILLVDDDPGSIKLMSRILSSVGELRFATSGEDALRLASECAPDLVLLDAEMPGMSGFEALEALKAQPHLVDVPVVFVTSHSDAAFEVSGFERGAADFIAKPVNPRLVLARVKSQLRAKRMGDELRYISATDVMTGVANRRRFEESLDNEWRRSQRSMEPLALLLIDVDHFKAFNDRYGHPAGDDCLRSLAQALAGVSSRATDLVARYGGEEFAVLLPLTSRDGAEYVAQTILQAMGTLAITHERSPTAAYVTVSIGIACHYGERDPNAMFRNAARPAHGRRGEPWSAIDLVHVADQALYASKLAGRDRARTIEMPDDRTQATSLDAVPLRVAQRGARSAFASWTSGPLASLDGRR